ncbi:MAG TPA: hypothetical protein VK205_12405 [Prolixibacteraceae bacterium]|nr:hypothetical protein [Prolixibacteraceae bacterium]
MKTSFPRPTFLLVFVLLFSFITRAQTIQDSIKNQVETMDGNEYIGIILNQTSESIRLKTETLGEITIPRSEIRRITQLSATKSKDGTYWLDNPQATRYFWAPNGYNLKAGEGYYQNVWVLFNQAVVGLTDYFSAGAGVMPLFLFDGAPTPAWVTAKFSIPVIENRINLGAGALIGTVLGAENTDNPSFGVVYGISTFGSKDVNLNVGLGWGFAGGEVADNPTLNVSTSIRTGAKGYFISENYLIGTPEETVVIAMIGGRRIIKHAGLDFGVVLPFSKDINGFIGIPWLGLTIPFGNTSSSMTR